MSANTVHPPVVVTGGATGIGYAIAEAFAQAAYPVAISMTG
jgi:NAD(P)-dependent dehydrogenase (short-subunit alcohol dehydrogenase family)